MGWRQTRCPLGLQKKQEGLSWLFRIGIAAKRFHLIGFVLAYLATASLYKWCPCADVVCVIILSTSRITEEGNDGN